MSSEELPTMSEAESFRAQHLQPNPTDFKILIAGFEFNVHKKLLEQQSGFFRALFKNPCTENNTSSVTLHDDYPQDVACFVHYLCYHHYYPSTNDADEGLSTLDLLKVALVNKYDEAKISTITLIENTNEDRGRNWARFIRHSNLYVLADKYDVPGLKEIAMEAMVDLMHASDHLVVWDLVGRLSASGVDESKWKDSITEYLDACVAEFLEDDRFYEWIIRHKLVKQMMKAAFREVKEIP